MNKHLGDRSVKFEQPVWIIGKGSVAGQEEARGPLRECFDLIAEDGLLGEKTFEKAEKRLFAMAVQRALEGAGCSPGDMDFLVGEDLLNQIISASYNARDLSIPYFGIYGACSSMAESLTLGAMMVDGGFAGKVLCATSSHFATAERQFRFPLELGTPQTPTAQNTVTGAGATILSATPAYGSRCYLSGATVGTVVDMGITDANNMGAAMAGAALETIGTHLEDFKRTPKDYDAIVTGDLGTFGTELLLDMAKRCGIDIERVHRDCGVMIFEGVEGKKCGGSGCGCGGSVLNGYFLRSLEEGKMKRILFVATGALLSTTSVQQGESIPGVAHGVVIERREA